MKRSLFAKGSIVLTAFSATLFSYGTASALSYNIVGLGTFGVESYGYGINDSGQVTGYSRMISGDQHAFLYDGSSMRDLGALDGSHSMGYGINNSGQVVGSYYAGFSPRALFYDGSSMQDIGTLGGSYSTGLGINDFGQIVGWAYTTGGTQHAFLYDGNSMQDLGTLGGSSSVAYGINNSGQVTGYSSGRAFFYEGSTMHDLGLGEGSGYGINDSGQVTGYYSIDGVQHAFLHDGASTQDLGTLGGNSSFGYGINNFGLIVGESYTTGDSAVHAFLHEGTSMIDLNSFLGDGSGWTLHSATDINNSGQITGYGIFNGIGQAFIMTPFEEAPVASPVPEPSTFMLIGSGLGGFALIRRFRRNKENQ